MTLSFSSSCCGAGGRLSCRIPAQPESSCCVTSSPLQSCREPEPLGRSESLLLVLFCGQRSHTPSLPEEDVTVPGGYHHLRARTCLACCHRLCDTEQECSYVGRPKFPAGSKERALQAGGTMVLSSRASPGSDATDVPASVVPAFFPSHTSVCRTFMHILAFAFVSQRGKRQLGEHSLHL